jgi:hypothetical protein
MREAKIKSKRSTITRPGVTHNQFKPKDYCPANHT